MNEIPIRNWRVSDEGSGVLIFCDPAIETVRLYEGGMDVAYEVREGREAVMPGTDQLLLTW